MIGNMVFTTERVSLLVAAYWNKRWEAQMHSYSWASNSLLSEVCRSTTKSTQAVFQASLTTAAEVSCVPMKDFPKRLGREADGKV